MVDSGVVRFSRQDPFRPRIALSAGMETKGYDIDARIEGPIGNPEILLTSSPPLPNDQLLLLFLTGQTPTGTGQGVGAAQAVGVYLAQDVLVRWLGGGTTEEDSLLDNLVFEYGAEVSHSGAPTITGRYYLDSRRKRTGRTTYLTAEKDVWDKTNFGYGIRFRFE
jgi:translocation and assembly module TamB